VESPRRPPPPLPLPARPATPRTSSSDTALTASSSSPGTRLPKSVVERKFSTARPHLSSARRSRIFHRLLHLPVSFPTSAQRIFCWAFHSRHSLRMYSCVVRSSRIVANCGHDA